MHFARPAAAGARRLGHPPPMLSHAALTFAVHAAPPRERDLVCSALGAAPDALLPGSRVASTGRQRILMPISTRSALMALDPDYPRLRQACDELDLLGAYVHTVPTGAERVSARMFAPSIGVPEDIANVNSTACLATGLAEQGMSEIRVDMGDALGCPGEIAAIVQRSASAPLIRVGGAATIERTVRLG
jgi:trans-2,3-dihydro-3-hydroxyanthranilate isomerase